MHRGQRGVKGPVRGPIEGVVITPLSRITDERGAVFHMLRCDDPQFDRFGEIYFSMVYPGAVKGWHVHLRMTLNYAAVKGMVKLVLFDERKGSRTRGHLMEVFIGDDRYARVTVPPGVWNGFKGLGDEPAIVANCATHPHDPQEILRRPPTDRRIGYDWARRDG